MNTRSRLVLLVLLTGIITAACGQTPVSDPQQPIERSPNCVQFGITDNVGFTERDGIPVDPNNGGKRYERVAINCDTQLVTPTEAPLPTSIYSSTEPSYPTLIPPGGQLGSDPSQPLTDDPGLPIAKSRLGDPVSVQWLDPPEKTDTLLSSSWVVVPAQTFQCLIDQKVQPDYKCDGTISASIEASSFTGKAYEISTDGSLPIKDVTFSLGHTDSSKQETSKLYTLASEKNIHWKATEPRYWTAVLVLKRAWQREGRAVACYGRGIDCMHESITMQINEDFIVATKVGTWDALVKRFRDIAAGDRLRPVLDVPLKSVPEPVTWDYRHQEYPGPASQDLGPGFGDGFKFVWTREQSSLRSSESSTKSSVKWVTLSAGQATSNSQGAGQTNTSSAELTFGISEEAAQKGPVRCFELYTVGEHGDTIISGFILNEEACR